MVQFSHSYMTTGKTVSLTRWTFVGKVMYLHFKTLSSLVIVFLPRSKHLLISWLQSPSAVVWEPRKIACHCFHCFPLYLAWDDGIGYHDLRFWALSFKPTLSLFSFTFIKRLLSSSSLPAIRVVPSACLRLILIPACASSSPAFCMMYSAVKLNKQYDNIQPWRMPFPIWKQSIVPYLVLTLSSWPACRFLRRQGRWSGILISLRIFHNLLWSTQSKALA